MKPETDLDRAVLESLADGVVVTGSDGRTRFLNAAAREVFGLSSAAASQATDLLDVFLRGLAELGPAGRCELVLLKPRGRVLSARVTPLIGPDGSPGGQVAVLRDVTDTRLGQRRRDVVFTVAAHDLASSVERLAQSLEPDPSRRGALGAALGLRDQVENLIRFSDIEMGPVRLLRRRVDLADLAKQALAGRRAKLLETGAGPATAYVDVAQVTVAIGLLLDRFESIETLGGPLDVIVDRDGAGAMLTMEGQASPEAADRAGELLDARAQVATYLDTLGSRIDLGAAYARHIVESHGGAVAYEREGRAFRIRMRFPPGGAGPEEAA